MSSWKWGHISSKQLDVLSWWHPNHPWYSKDMIISDGSIRSGKTISNAFSYSMWANCSFTDTLFGMAGKTIGSFRKNVLPDLIPALAARGVQVDDRRNDNLLTMTYMGKSNGFEVFGGKDESSQDLIQGRTLAGMLLDEAVLMPESFVNQAIARCSVDGSRIWITCNPGSPFHFIKTKFIDALKSRNAAHVHFELDDNLNLSERIRTRLKNSYSGLFHSRYIKGLWVLAEGVIYDMFNREKHVQVFNPASYSEFFISIDYGTFNPFAAGLFGTDGDTYHLGKLFYYDSVKHKKQKTDSEYIDLLINNLFPGFPIESIYCDPSAASFLTALRNDRRIDTHILPAINDVSDGIRHVSEQFSKGKLLIDPSCTEAIDEVSTYMWDVKAQARGIDAPVKKQDHCPDMIRYGLFTRHDTPEYIERLQKRVH